MIAVDTSALMAIVLGEADAEPCMAILEAEGEIIISAGTLAEILIVAARRAVEPAITSLIDRLNFEVVPVTTTSARRMGEAYRQWGRGMHPAALNFGDCFAYELAREYACPLLYVGNDFAKTDVESAL